MHKPKRTLPSAPNMPHAALLSLSGPEQEWVPYCWVGDKRTARLTDACSGCGDPEPACGWNLGTQSPGVGHCRLHLKRPSWMPPALHISQCDPLASKWSASTVLSFRLHGHQLCLLPVSSPLTVYSTLGVPRAMITSSPKAHTHICG